MRVLAEEPWSCFLLEEDGRLYLDVLVEHGAISFSVTSELSPEQATRYADEGVGYLRDLSSAMRHKALMREWSAMPLPADWEARSITAIREWQKRGNG
ncbi:hypothetical protein BLA23254_07638 [Burkholderia lata]|uniref:Uncharacterized protein n=1 Tax=Burkholderia lata (strain ATCC 17760 / DSM 23089 / LMG 22485 / NCIMB 9086 / R18194 / 383) TaxID=482957 RepID=A0A6P2SZV1_BURL3|nr:hypothetical protein [Burkholderia lata]VWC49198.1 hypothetical protein BLA23254_07638 [Burkholderia lata]